MKKITFSKPVRDVKLSKTFRLSSSDRAFIEKISKKEKVPQTAIVEAALKLLRDSLDEKNH